MDKDLRIEQLEEKLKNAKSELNQQNPVKPLDSSQIFENTELYLSILDNIRTPHLVLSPDLEIVFSNSEFLKAFDISKEQIIGKNLTDLESGSCNFSDLLEFFKSIQTPEEQVKDYEIGLDFNSGKKYLLLNAKKINLEEINNDYILLSIEDISERKKAEIELKESEHRLREMIHSSKSLIAILRGPDMKIEIANDAIKNVWGKGTDVEGTSLFELLPEIVDQGMPEIFRKVYETGEVFVAQESPIMHMKDGKMILGYFDFIYQAQRDLNGNIEGVSIIATEVTNQALLNKKIKKNEKEFRELVDFMPHKISVANREGKGTFYNKSLLKYTGYTSEQLEKISLNEFIHPAEKEKLQSALDELILEGKDFELELRIKDYNDNYKWHLCRAIPIKDENGEVSTFISSCTEIQKLKEEEKRKESFLKLVSHELKTPVTSIKGYVQLLLSLQEDIQDDNGSGQKVKPYLNRIQGQVDRLIRLISEMLDLSRIEQNELQLQKNEFNLNKQVENIVEDISYTNIEAQIEIEHFCECNVVADRDRIGQVIINLINNAIKYSTTDKKIRVTVFNHDDDSVAVGVQDYGIGIEKKDLKNIFKRFYRVSDKNEPTYSGFGIGLYLSREIIKRHKGEIYVISEKDKGSQFIFTLPKNNQEENG